MNERDKTRILVVDDQLTALKGVSRLLSNAGYETSEAATGSEALRLAQELRPDLILLDVVLPDIQGTEVCRAIKADKSLASTYVVMHSSIKTESDSQADGLDLGADGYIARPIPNRELLARIAALLRLKSLEKRLAGALNFAQTVLETSPVGMATFRRDGSMITANGALLSIIGMAKDGVSELNIKEIECWKESGLPEDAEDVLETGMSKRREILAALASRKQVWLDCRLAAFDSGDESGLLLMANDITEMKEAENQRDKLVQDLREALSQVKRLSGLLPICSFCKKIRDDQGYWEEVDRYVHEHSEAQFSHGICPDCYKKHYPEFFDER